MPVDLTNTLVVGISSRALFDLEKEAEIFDQEGLEAYCHYQLEHEDEVLPLGTGFPLVKAILNLNERIPGDRKAEVIIMSRNNADTSLRISNSINHYGLDITRGAFTSGVPVSKYLGAFDTDLFLSASEDDVRIALASGVAAGLIYSAPQDLNAPINQLRVAFDGDAVIFSAESEQIYQTQGLDAFLAHERANARKPLPEGPFAKLLKSIAYLQRGFTEQEAPIRTALVTARNSPAHERVIRTLRYWEVRIDEVFFMGGVAKDKLLRAFQPHIFFDDQPVHCIPAAQYVPTARVPTT